MGPQVPVPGHFGPSEDVMDREPGPGASAEGAKVRGHDPEAGPNFVASLGEVGDGFTLVDDPYTAAEGADALLLVTEWHEYRSPDFQRLRQIMAQPALFDGRNQWDRAAVEALGFHYDGIGRGTKLPPPT